MRLVWERDRGILHHGSAVMVVTCIVRNELNGRRKRSEIPVLTENEDGSDGVPYMPRPFPRGVWKVTGAFAKAEPYMAPFFISTDAHQPIEVWSVIDGHYGEKTGEMVEDYGYGLHCSTSISTLGCGRVQMRAELLALVDVIAKEPVTLEVV